MSRGKPSDYSLAIFEKYGLSPDGWGMDIHTISQAIRESPWTKVLTPGLVRLVDEDGGDEVHVRSMNDDDHPVLGVFRANGTPSNETPVDTDDILGDIVFGGAVDAGNAPGDFARGAYFRAIVTGSSIGGGPLDTTPLAQIAGENDDPWNNLPYGFVGGIVEVGQKLYVSISSEPPNSSVPSLPDAAIWEYDLTTETWTDRTGPWTDEFWASNIVHHNGFLYVGLGGNANSEAQVWEYEIAADTWTDVSQGSGFGEPGTQCLAIDTANGLLYAGTEYAGGEVWRYNIGTTTWDQIGTPGTDYPNGTSDGGTRWLLVSGASLFAALRLFNGGTGSSRNQITIQEWTGSSWTTRGGEGGMLGGSVNGLPGAHDGVGEIVEVTSGGDLYIGVSEDDGDGDAAVYHYDRSGDTWTKVGGSSMNSSWSSAQHVSSLAMSGTNFLLAGVSDGTNFSLWEYDINAGTWEELIDGSTATDMGTYDRLWRMGFTSSGFLYGGFATSQGVDADVWLLGFANGQHVPSNLELHVGAETEIVIRQKWFSNGDIGMGTDLDGVFWDESERRLGINTDTPSCTLDVNGDVCIDGDFTVEDGNSVTLPAGSLDLSFLEDVSAESRLLGRGEGGGSGSVEEITLGDGLSMAGTVLSASATTVYAPVVEAGVNDPPVFVLDNDGDLILAPI